MGSPSADDEKKVGLVAGADLGARLSRGALAPQPAGFAGLAGRPARPVGWLG